MKVNKEVAKQLRIPTFGMERFRLSVMSRCGHYKEADNVRAFLESGMLHNNHKRSDALAYFIQRNDGYLAVERLSAEMGVEAGRGVTCEPSIFAHLKAGVATDFIVTKVDSAFFCYRDKLFLNKHYGPLAFLAEHHPDAYTREYAWLRMAEMFMATASDEEKAAFSTVYEERATELGIRNAS